MFYVCMYGFVKLQAVGKVVVAVKGMYKTIKFPQVWKPSLYMYLSLALSLSTHEGMFYWYTDPKAGPAFSQVSFSTSHTTIYKILQNTHYYVCIFIPQYMPTLILSYSL